MLRRVGPDFSLCSLFFLAVAAMLVDKEAEQEKQQQSSASSSSSSSSSSPSLPSSSSSSSLTHPVKDRVKSRPLNRRYAVGECKILALFVFAPFSLLCFFCFHIRPYRWLANLSFLLCCWFLLLISTLFVLFAVHFCIICRFADRPASCCAATPAALSTSWHNRR